jgi:hypothetical protein
MTPPVCTPDGNSCTTAPSANVCPTLESVQPSQSHVSGGLNVTVTIAELDLSLGTTWGCIFDNLPVEGRVINSSAVECTTPPHPQGIVPLFLTNDGVPITTIPLDFFYYGSSRSLFLLLFLGLTFDLVMFRMQRSVSGL